MLSPRHPQLTVKLFPCSGLTRSKGGVAKLPVYSHLQGGDDSGAATMLQRLHRARPGYLSATYVQPKRNPASQMRPPAFTSRFSAVSAGAAVALILTAVAASAATTKQAPKPAAPASKPTVEGPLKVENFSGITGLQAHLEKVLPAQTKRYMRENDVALWAWAEAFTFDSGGYCLAGVGLTAAAPDDRNGRLPEHTFTRFTRAPKSKWNPENCKIEALGSAIANLARSDLKTVIKGIERTGKAEPLPVEPPRPDLVQTAFSGVPNKQEIWNAMFAAGWNRTFDYREAQLAMWTVSTRFDDGEWMCVAFAGIVGRTPESVNARMPARRASNINVGAENEQTCRQQVSLAAAKEVLRSAWNTSGALGDFSFVREDGVRQPSPAYDSESLKPDTSARVDTSDLKPIRR